MFHRNVTVETINVILIYVNAMLRTLQNLSRNIGWSELRKPADVFTCLLHSTTCSGPCSRDFVERLSFYESNKNGLMNKSLQMNHISFLERNPFIIRKVGGFLHDNFGCWFWWNIFVFQKHIIYVSVLCFTGLLFWGICFAIVSSISYDAIAKHVL